MTTAGLQAQHAWREIQLPQARVLPATVFEPNRGTILQFGGYDEWSLGDTWRWHGATQAWNRIATANRPSPRYGHRMVHDLARDQVLLFGGYDGSFRNDTWYWDGSAWFELFPATAPGGRYRHGLAYDAQRGRAVLYGGWNNGRYQDTWEWTGNQWLQRLPTSSPGPLEDPGMVYDPCSRTTFLFGGINGGGSRTNNTWTWNGQAWTELFPATRPPVRMGSQLAFVPGRNRIVMHGGETSGASLDDTWEWDCVARNWTQVVAGGGPGPRQNHTLVYDPTRDRAVLMGGDRTPSPGIQFSDVWEWDGTTWTQHHATMPTGRWGTSMAFHAPGGAGNHMLLFGGRWNPSAGQQLGDTWLWNGTAWSQPSLSLSPSPRGHTALVYDPARQQTVLFGGWTGVLNGETWTWSGTAWTQRSPSVAPSARDEHKMTFHPGLGTAGEVVLFGGYTGVANNELWSWDGTNWTNRTQASGNPAARWYHTIAYDPVGDRIVLFGGYNGSSRFGDTWSWTLQNGWVQLAPVQSPSARYTHAMAYDPTRGSVVLFGGHDGADRGDTWELRGSAWVKCTQAWEPPAREAPGLAFDSDRQRLLLFGGWPTGGDFWECFNPNPASFAPIAGSNGCPLGTNQLQLAPATGSLPWRGESLLLELSGLPASVFLNAYVFVGFPPAVPVPVPGFPQCVLQVGPPSGPLGPLPIPTGTATATATISIPPIASYVGLDFMVQGVVVNLFPFQLGMTGAAVCRIGAHHQ